MPLIARIAIVFASGAIAGAFLAVPPSLCLLPLAALLFTRKEAVMLMCIGALGVGLAAQHQARPAEVPHHAAIQHRIDELFPNTFPVAEALLISERKALDPEVKAAFAAAGLSHMLAISGAHVGLIAGMVITLAGVLRFSRRSTNVVGLAGATAYVFMLGAPFAALRSLLQMVLLMLSRARQQPAHPIGMLAFAAIVITAIDPSAPLDIGFQLSFAGIAALILWRRPLIELMPKRIPSVVRDALGSTLAAVAMTTPIAAFHFGTVSAIAPLANLIAAPVMAIALPATVLVVAVSAISMPLAKFLAPGAELTLHWFTRIAEVAAAVPGGHFSVARATAMLATLSVGLAFYLLRGSYRSTLRGRAAIASLAAAVPIAAAPSLNWSDHIEIHMIDVGQGDAIAIRSPHGRWLLVDAGPVRAKFDAGKSRVAPFLLEHNATRVDALLISHPHLDHYGGARAVMDRIPVMAVIDPIMATGRADYDSLLAASTSHKVRWLAARTGRSLTLDGLRIDFLAPESVTATSADAANDFSETFRLSYGRFSALFTGDTSCKGEEVMLREHPELLDVDVLKVGHHGSGTSSCMPFLQAVTPKVALISVGQFNRYHHPNPAALARLAEAGARIFRTDKAGTISVVGRKDGTMEVATSK